MRVEALDVNLGANTILPAFFPMQAGEALPEITMMGATGRSFPIEEILKSQQPQKAGRRVSSGRGLNLHDIVKLLQVGSNKLRILKLLRRADWINLLHLMPKELLINALRLFSKSKLMRLIMMLPKRLLIKMLLRIFKLEDLMKKMPTVELMRILRSGKLNNRELVKGLQKMDPAFVMLLLQRIYGDYDYSHLKQYDMMRIFMHTNKERLMEAFKTLPFKVLTPFVTEFVKRDPELLMNISDAFIFKLLDRMSKPTLLQACTVLPNDILIKFLTQLPNQLLMR